MRKFKRIFTWYLLLQKRLLKKPLFLILLILIPVLCLFYSDAAREESGVLTIALAQEGRDPLASRVIADLAGSSQLIHFRVCETTEEATDLVRREKADAAWLFPADMQQRMEAFAAEPKKSNAFVTVVERESSVLLLLTQEKLGGELYDLCAETVYLNFIRQNIPEMKDASNEELLHYYRNSGISDTLFLFEQTDGTPQEENTANYLTAPVRGLLAVVVILSGIAAAMYYIRDLQLGTFSWVPMQLRPAAELGCLLVATGDLTLAAMISLLVSGLAGPVLVELLALVQYGLCAAVFCMMLCRIFGSVRALGALLPLLVTGMLVVCPVFFDLGMLRQLQYLLPPTYYIHCVYNSSYSLYMLLYTLACAAVYLLTGLFRKQD